MLSDTIYNLAPSLTEASEHAQLHSQGDNGLMLVCKSADYTDETKEMLSKMLGAIKREVERTTICTTHADQVSISDLLSAHKINALLVFGINPAHLGLNISIPPYQVVDMEGLKIILSHPLTTILNDKAKKISLWQCLQTL